MMNYRRLGRTNLRVSAVGYGTCQLRMVPEQQAIDSMKQAFSLGVNIVHTAPDYAGADDLVAEAVKASGREVIVCSQGFGSREVMEHHFEETCAKLGKRRLELFGIACVDDREMEGENVWEAGGMVEFLNEKKAQGRLQGTFCTTHGTPLYIQRLVESNAFDAILLAYNPLGYHLLSYKPDPPAEPEELFGNRDLFPIFASHDVGLMLMKPLAGGLLCSGRAFRPHDDPSPRLRARDVLRYLLVKHPEVACLMPGTNSPAEAEENALAAHGPLREERGIVEEIESTIGRLQITLCNRCGRCDELCSRHLPVSWLFRAAYIEESRSMPFETLDRHRYFMLHPWTEAPRCSTCAEVTCRCPVGLNIPVALTAIHERMTNLRLQEIPAPQADPPPPNGSHAARLVAAEWERPPVAGHRCALRLVVDNTGTHGWHNAPGLPVVTLEAAWMRAEPPSISPAPSMPDPPFQKMTRTRMRGDIPTGQRGYFVIEPTAPFRKGCYDLEFRLTFLREDQPAEQIPLGRIEVSVAEP